MSGKSTETRNAPPFRYMYPGDIETVIEQNEKFAQLIQNWGEEMLSFGTCRLKENIAVPRQLAGCTTPEEVVNVYMNFFNTAFRQYSEEAVRLGGLYDFDPADGKRIAVKPEKGNGAE